MDEDQRCHLTRFEGVLPHVTRRYAQEDASRERFAGYMREVPCPACGGARLKPAVPAATVAGRAIAELTALPIDQLARFVQHLELEGCERRVADAVVAEIGERLRFLLDVGLDHLSPNRPVASLSGGEARRIRPATQIGAGLVGVLYVLDEPSIGPHQRDNRRLIETLLRLRDRGNTVIVVEHDEETVKVADRVVGIGPGAGAHGGHVVHSGTARELLDHPTSLTGAYLSGRRRIPLPASRRPRTEGRALTVHYAGKHNLRDVSVSFPLGQFVTVTGVSGSGKSTLVNDILDVHMSLRPVAAAVRTDPEGEGARLPAGPVLLQPQGRPLRALLRRRHPQGRDELPP